MTMVNTQMALSDADISTADFSDIYEKTFPVVAGFIAKRGGSFDDAQDIFQDALIIYHEKQMSGLQLRQSRETYILGISKHLWIKRFNDSKHLLSLSEKQEIEIPADFDPSINSSRLMNFLESVGKRCMDLLSASYLQKKKVFEITREFKYSNEHSVAVQKYKCIEKLRASVKQKPELYESLFE